MLAISTGLLKSIELTSDLCDLCVLTVGATLVLGWGASYLRGDLFLASQRLGFVTFLLAWPWKEVAYCRFEFGQQRKVGTPRQVVGSHHFAV